MPLVGNESVKVLCMPTNYPAYAKATGPKLICLHVIVPGSNPMLNQLCYRRKVGSTVNEVDNALYI